MWCGRSLAGRNSERSLPTCDEIQNSSFKIHNWLVRPPGLYEELVTRRLEAALEEIRGEGWRDEVTKLDPAEAPGVLARFVHDLVEPLLGSLTGDDRTARQLEIVNNLVDHSTPCHSEHRHAAGRRLPLE